MPRRARDSRQLLTIGKRTGLCLCIAIAGVWLASGWWIFGWERDGDPRRAVYVSEGLIHIQRQDTDGMAPGPWYGGVGAGYGGFTGWRWGFDWGYPLRVSGYAIDQKEIPLWAPFLLAATMTTLLWRSGRRPLPGHCPCGYNLTGNTSSVCPECGRAD